VITLIVRMTHLAWEDNEHPLPPHERYGHTKEKFENLEMAHANLLGMV
jgi:hypothetical protein